MTLPVCPVDGEPVIFTFEFPGAEYVCVECGRVFEFLAIARATATDDLVVRHAENAERYERERVERGGTPAPPRPDREPPVCGRCGATSPTSSKPPHWYSRVRDGEEQFACSRECITDGAVLPW